MKRIILVAIFFVASISSFCETLAQLITIEYSINVNLNYSKMSFKKEKQLELKNFYSLVYINPREKKDLTKLKEFTAPDYKLIYTIPNEQTPSNGSQGIFRTRYLHNK